MSFLTQITALCCNLLLLYLYKPWANVLCLGQILLYALVDVCHLINSQCLINLGLKDRFWSGDVLWHSRVLWTGGREFQVLHCFSPANRYRKNTENKTHVKVFSLFSVTLASQIFKQVLYSLSICARCFLSFESKTSVIFRPQKRPEICFQYLCQSMLAAS